MKEMVGGCCVCSDERGWPDNPLVYCDGNGCTVAVHQACYGIVTVPTGPWFCRKCESPDTKGKVRCELCPSKSGALKRSDTGGWAHVVCALYIPEVRFGNVTSMEPIVLRLIPSERYNKTCYICQEQGKANRASAGACMQCNKSGCKQQFHVTCAQSLGLLCEEAGNYLDNVKYCGYCQHHYSKLKKGGNVKTIPPYKPVSHDSQSSDSSGEKEGDTSPKTGGSVTPTHAKSKGAGRKSSHSSAPAPSKNASNPAKTPSNTTQPMDTSPEAGEENPPPSSRKNKSTDKQNRDKGARKSSPGRRSSLAGDSGSKTNTPTPSPQHTGADQQALQKGGGSTPKTAPPAASPSSKPQESVGVISSVSAATANITASASSAVTTSVVQTPTATKPAFQESVITNAEESKQTKKRKAVSVPGRPAPPSEYPPQHHNPVNEHGNMWENPSHPASDVPMETVDKIVKKAKTEEGSMMSHYNPNPPPPASGHSPSSQPSPRHLPSPMPGPSGINQSPNIRSPSQQQAKAAAGEAPTSLLVSVPLPSTSQGLNLSQHAQMSGVPTENAGQSSHLFHQVHKQATMEQGVPPHSPHAGPTVPGRTTWGGLTISYERHEPNKTGVTPPISKDASTSVGTNIRNKKRAAMSTSVVSMTNTSASTIHTPPAAQMRPQPTSPLVYQETIKDSPPTSPGSERPLKPTVEKKGPASTAPHMLGNELNPESGVAARLQEQLSAELAAHAAGGAGDNTLYPPPLINRGSGSRGGSAGGATTSSAQSLDQLLERQWEQGSQFLMEQAQHFDIASLLSCLHQLRTENVRLEEHVGSLLQRRDHLLAVNARLAIPLTQQTLSSGQPGGGEPSRCPRENGAQMRAPPGLARTETITAERAHQMMVREVQQKPS